MSIAIHAVHRRLALKPAEVGRLATAAVQAGFATDGRTGQKTYRRARSAALARIDGTVIGNAFTMRLRHQDGSHLDCRASDTTIAPSPLSAHSFLRRRRAHSRTVTSTHSRAPPSCSAAHVEYAALSLPGNDPNHAVCTAHSKNTAAANSKATVNAQSVHVRKAIRDGPLTLVLRASDDASTCLQGGRGAPAIQREGQKQNDD